MAEAAQAASVLLRVALQGFVKGRRTPFRAGILSKGMGEGAAPADELGSEAIADHPSQLGAWSSSVPKCVTIITQDQR